MLGFATLYPTYGAITFTTTSHGRGSDFKKIENLDYASLIKVFLIFKSVIRNLIYTST